MRITLKTIGGNSLLTFESDDLLLTKQKAKIEREYPLDFAAEVVSLISHIANIYEREIDAWRFESQCRFLEEESEKADDTEQTAANETDDEEIPFG
ncbi:MAG: hypothetical protein IJP68_09580 [Selenomonadaceae bacterium]|nr:hypothetical protein [Selenomonadaceae bacterium]